MNEKKKTDTTFHANDYEYESITQHKFKRYFQKFRMRMLQYISKNYFYILQWTVTLYFIYHFIMLKGEVSFPGSEHFKRNFSCHSFHKSLKKVKFLYFFLLSMDQKYF